ncbi:MAG: hypothetical protein R6W48_01480 [Gaiellaceae bacterium]
MRRLCTLLAAGAAAALVLVGGAAPGPAQPSLGKARLHGNFDVTTRVLSASGIDVARGSKDTGTWGFKPICGSGACDVRLTFSYRGASFDRHRLTVSLDRRAASYRGTGTARFLECNFADVPGPVTVTINVTKAAMIGGVWRATRVRGSYVHTTRAASSGIYTCPATRLTVAINGTLPDY